MSKGIPAASNYALGKMRVQWYFNSEALVSYLPRRIVQVIMVSMNGMCDGLVFFVTQVWKINYWEKSFKARNKN